MIKMLVKSWIPLQYSAYFKEYFSKLKVLTSLLTIRILATSVLVVNYLKTLYRIYIELRLLILEE